MGQGWSVQNAGSETYYTGKTAQRIAKESGVVFEEGTLKKIQPYTEFRVDAMRGTNDVEYKAILSDGTRVEYKKQLPTNKSRIKVTGNKVSIFGVQGMYVTSPRGKASFYDVYGCQGFVETVDGDRKDTIKTHSRKMSSGEVQPSYMLVHHDDKDVFVETKNDKRYIGN